METQLVEELEAVLNIPDNTTTQVDGHRRQGDKDLFFFSNHIRAPTWKLHVENKTLALLGFIFWWCR